MSCASYPAVNDDRETGRHWDNLVDAMAVPLREALARPSRGYNAITAAAFLRRRSA